MTGLYRAFVILLVITLAPSLASAGLVSEWKFDGNGTDTMGVQTATTVGGAFFQTSGGVSGGYADILSGTDSVSIPYNAAYDLTSNFTVEFWFRQYSDQGFLQNLVYKGSGTNNYNWRIYRQLYDGSSNFGPIIAGYTSTGPTWNQVSNSNILSHGVWHHVAYVNGSSGHSYYLDGALISTSGDTAPAITPAMAITVGDSAVNTDIDELRIWDYARSQTEIQNYIVSLTPPAWISGYPSVSGIGGDRFNLNLNLDKAGTAFWVVIPDGEVTPNSIEVRNGTGGGGMSVVASGSTSLSANTAKAVTVTGLTPALDYDVYVVAQDTESTPNLQVYPESRDVTTAATISVTVPPGSTSAEYKIISVPVSLGDQSPTGAIGSQIGTYNTTLYRIGRWNPSLAGYGEYPSVTNLKPGHAYWFLARNGLSLSFSGSKSPETTNPDGYQSVRVALEQGWNQVGNPFTYSVSVGDIIVEDSGTSNYEYLTSPTYNITQGVYWVYNGGTYSSASSLPAAVGGWVKKLTSGPGWIYYQAVFLPADQASDTAPGVVPDSITSPVAADVERPPSPPGADSTSGGWSSSGGGGGGGGGGCFVSSVN